MPRKLKSPTRTITNRGPRSKYIGHFPCSKSTAEYILFDSVTSLTVGLLLEQRPDVECMSFESRKFGFEGGKGDKPFFSIPDYEAYLKSGEIIYREAKYSRQMGKGEAQKIALTAALMKANGFDYDVIYRTDLESDGQIGLIAMLRPYGLLKFNEKTLAAAETGLSAFGRQTLLSWRIFARVCGFSIAVVYHLIYQGRLLLSPTKQMGVEVEECLG